MKFYAYINDYMAVMEANGFRTIYNAVRRQARYGDRKFTATLFRAESLEAENREQIGTIFVKRHVIGEADFIIMTVHFWGWGNRSHYRSFAESWDYERGEA